MTTFKEKNAEGHVDLQIKKSGLSLAIIFSRDQLDRFGLSYGDVIRLDDAEIIKL